MSGSDPEHSGRAAPTALVIGEALVDEVVTGTQTTTYPGGSPFNVAVGLGRLGIPTRLHTAVGNDERGTLLQRHAEASGVVLTPESSTPATTSSARAVIGADGAAAYDFTVTWAPRPFTLSTAPRVVHAGSIAAAIPPGSDLVAGVLSALRPTSIVSLDPNVRPQLTPDRDATRRRLLELITLADVIKVSDEDLEWIHPAARVEDVASEWLAHGPDLVVVTRGSSGSTGFSRWGEHRTVPPDTGVADSIGAGDSFMAGLLGALMAEGADVDRGRLTQLDQFQIERSLTFATRCAAVTVSRPGADPPWEHEVLL